MTGAPTMLPTARYDPDWDAVWIWSDCDTPFLVTRNAVEDLIGSHERVSPDHLIDICKARTGYFAAVAASKLASGYVDRKGRAVIMPYDLKQIVDGSRPA